MPERMKGGRWEGRWKELKRRKKKGKEEKRDKNKRETGGNGAKYANGSLGDAFSRLGCIDSH